MRAAVIENGIVVNVVVVADWYAGPAVPTGELPVAIGDSYDGTGFFRNGERLTVPPMEGGSAGEGVDAP